MERRCSALHNEDSYHRAGNIDLLYAVLTSFGIMLLLATQIACWSQRMPPRVTVKEVDKRIRSEIPIGSSLSRVMAFVDSLKFDSVKIVHSEYLPILPDDSLELIPSEVEAAAEGHVIATLVNVERDDLAAYNIDIYFYFGKGGHLIHYTVKKHGTVP